MGIAKSRSFTVFSVPFPVTRHSVKSLVADLKLQKILDPACVVSILDQFCAKCDSKGHSAIVDIAVSAKDSKLVIVGDTHGQYFDLMQIFDTNGVPSQSVRYLFNGDFVDRGAFGIEVVLTLFIYKLMWPEYITLLRGNHEIRSVNNAYGFKQELWSKYSSTAFGTSEKLFTKFNIAFSKLPVAALINDKVFVVHGGIPRTNNGDVAIQQLRELSCDVEPEVNSILSDMLWSDPQDENGFSPSPREVGVLFGPDASKRFLERNQLKLIIRSHQLCHEGYSFQAGGGVLTIFSAPNYCGRCGNLGAYAVLDSDNTITIQQFGPAARQEANSGSSGSSPYSASQSPRGNTTDVACWSGAVIKSAF